VTSCRYWWTKNEKKLDLDTAEISRPDASVGSCDITDASEQHVGNYRCFVSGKYGTAMSDIAELVMGVLDEFRGGETVTHHQAAQYSQFSLPCRDSPRSVPDPEYFWSYQTSPTSTHFTAVQLDSRLQVDQQGHLLFIL